MKHLAAWVAATTLVSIPFSAIASTTAHAAPLPADLTTPSVVKHVNTDVDGDGTRDSVDLTYLGADQFTLSATTTKGASSSVSFTSHVDPEMVPAAATWYGADAIDGHKGSELIVHLYDPNVTDSGQNRDVAVYTWRSGALYAEQPPAAPPSSGWEVGVTEGSEAASGYWFFTRHGHRYADASRLTMTNATPWRYEGTVTRSVWRNDGWVEVSTRIARTKSDLTWKQFGMAGPKLLLSQMKADISGDGQPDLLLFYRLGVKHYGVTVVAHGHRASADVTYWMFPFIGAAAVDGVPGNELLANIDQGRSLWKVLTWRHNKLVTLKAPALYGKAGNTATWHQSKTAWATNFALSLDNGSHYVVSGEAVDSQLTQPVRFARSVWTKGHWKKLSQWAAVLDDEQRAAFRRGFTAPDLVTP